MFASPGSLTQRSVAFCRQSADRRFDCGWLPVAEDCPWSGDDFWLDHRCDSRFLGVISKGQAPELMTNSQNAIASRNRRVRLEPVASLSPRRLRGSHVGLIRAFAFRVPFAYRLMAVAHTSRAAASIQSKKPIASVKKNLASLVPDVHFHRSNWKGFFSFDDRC